MASGRFGEAEAEMLRARQLDPLSLPAVVDLGLPHFFRGAYARAAEAYREAIELDPSFWYAHHRLGEALIELGDLGAAEACFANTLAGSGSAGELAVARVHARMGRTADARAALAAVLERSEVARPCFFAAGVRVALGEHDAAFDLLEQACDERDKWIGWLRVDPAIAELRSLPRFEAVLARAGFPTTASRA